MIDIKKDPIKVFLILNVGICYLLGIGELIFKYGMRLGTDAELVIKNPLVLSVSLGNSKNTC